MRRAALVGALTLALAAPAHAQSAAAPIVGSGSFNGAPLIAPGTYRDTVLPGEYLYYAVRVQAGQRLHVTARSELTGADLAGLNVGFVKLNLHAPDRVRLLSATGDQSFRGSDEPAADLITPPAATVAATDPASPSGWQGPGVYFLSVYAVYIGSGARPRAEIPFSFDVGLEGTPQTEPRATPVATATRAATATPTPTPAATPGPPPSVAAGAGAAGLLLGVAGGLGLRRRRR